MRGTGLSRPSCLILNLQNMSEREQSLGLESFQEEIHQIVEKIKDKDATAADIADVSQLTSKEMDLWNLYKDILKIIVSADEKKRDELLKLVDKLKNDGGYTPIDKTRHNFVGWINNRNPFPYAYAAKVYSMDKIKQKYAEDIELYLGIKV